MYVLVFHLVSWHSLHQTFQIYSHTKSLSTRLLHISAINKECDRNNETNQKSIFKLWVQLNHQYNCIALLSKGNIFIP